MRNRTKILVVAAAIASVAVVPAIASAVAGTEAGEVDVAIAGSALEQASTAALDHLGEGQVTGTEVGDEESYYEVEVTRDDGRQVDVQLDESFVVVGTEDDEVGSDD